MKSVAESFENKTILITGVTGFIGKVLLEKLLRCCREISKVYVIIREKRDKNAEERLQDILKLECFSVLRKSQPNFAQKIVAINGDITKDNIGMCDVELTKVLTEVSIIFHCAATVKFQEPLNGALLLNVMTVDNMMKLCQKIRNLEAMVHLSTAYSHCYLSHIKEQFYPLEGDLEFDVSKYSATEDYCELSKRVLNKFPNTYTYTKALAENLISDYKRKFPDLPITIVRPSIVSTSWKDPFPGWCDSLNGPVGLIIAFGKGLMRAMVGDDDALTNLIPVDLTVNTCIIAAWDVVTKCAAASDENVLPWGKFIKYILVMSKEYPLDNPFRVPAYNNKLCKNKNLYKLQWLLKHWIPAYIMDGAMFVIGKKTVFIRAYTKIRSVSESLTYFTTKSWSWDRDNVIETFSRLSDEDKEIFPVDTADIDWKEHVKDYHCGAKIHILKEDMCNVKFMKNQIYIREIAIQILKVLFLVYFLYTFIF